MRFFKGWWGCKRHRGSPFKGRGAIVGTMGLHFLRDGGAIKDTGGLHLRGGGL